MDNSSWLPKKTVQIHGKVPKEEIIGKGGRDIGAPFAWFAMQRLSYCIDVRCHVALDVINVRMVWHDLMFDDVQDVHRIIENCRDCRDTIVKSIEPLASQCLPGLGGRNRIQYQAPKMLPVEFGIWKTRFCDFQPATLTAHLISTLRH